MADDIFSSEDFDKLLDDFIATQLQDTEDSLAEMNEKSQKNQPAESANKDTAEKEENTD